MSLRLSAHVDDDGDGGGDGGNDDFLKSIKVKEYRVAAFRRHDQICCHGETFPYIPSTV